MLHVCNHLDKNVHNPTTGTHMTPTDETHQEWIHYYYHHPYLALYFINTGGPKPVKWCSGPRRTTMGSHVLTTTARENHFGTCAVLWLHPEYEKFRERCENSRPRGVNHPAGWKKLVHRRCSAVQQWHTYTNLFVISAESYTLINATNMTGNLPCLTQSNNSTAIKQPNVEIEDRSFHQGWSVWDITCVNIPKARNRGA